MARHSGGQFWGGTTIKTHRRSNANKSTYKAKHRQSFWGMLTGKRDVAYITQRNAAQRAARPAPGVFPGWADLWKPAGVTYGSNRSSIFGDWT